MKHYLLKIGTTFVVFATNMHSTFAEDCLLWVICMWGGGWGSSSGPAVVCNGLPGCSSWVTGKSFFGFLWNLISAGIKYVAVIAVIALIISGMMYLTSGWEDEKVKKAKKWIIWALVGVFVSTSAWAIINLVNSFRIN